MVKKRKWPLLYQQIRDMFPLVLIRCWPRARGVAGLVSMDGGRPVQSLFLELSRPQQKIPGGQRDTRAHTHHRRRSYPGP